MGPYCEAFALHLERSLKGIFITLTNEDCTTAGAKYIAASAFKIKNDKKVIDSIAAMLILEGFLQKLVLNKK
jgi:RNase H-fold protein (predicted Holliday junction resolvase)